MKMPARPRPVGSTSAQAQPAREETLHPPGLGPRLGPRPLALHLANATGAWMSSRAALPFLKSGSLPWRPELALQGAALQLSLGLAKSEDFSAALDAELTQRNVRLLEGIELYRHHAYHRALAEPPVLWQDGTTRLLDYGPSNGVPVLVVPSLINRAYILDLAEGQSLLRYLAGVGLRPLLLDWGAPGAAERNFDLTDYISLRLEPAAAAAAKVAGEAPIVMGYCMGGLLALALAARRPQHVRSLALLATPWRFHAERAAHARLLGMLAAPMTEAYAALGELPVDVLQGLFAAQDPLLVMRKFTRFAAMDQDGPAARSFVALEDWLNDGVPLSLPVARECLADWYGDDLPGRGRWMVGGVPIRPHSIEIPSLIVVPAQDRIVPPATAAVLVDELPMAERLTPPLGHIGMIVAREAPTVVWPRLADWLLAHGAPA